MTEDGRHIEGQCLCGAVTIRATPKRRHVEACHCRMCRTWGGSAFVSVQCGTDVAFEGEEAIVRYRSSEWAERGFCRSCGSHLFFHYLPLGTYGFLAGLFPDGAFEPLAEEIFIDQKPDYYAFAGDAETMTGAEVMAKFGVGEGLGGGG